MTDMIERIERGAEASGRRAEVERLAAALRESVDTYYAEAAKEVGLHGTAYAAFDERNKALWVEVEEAGVHEEVRMALNRYGRAFLPGDVVQVAQRTGLALEDSLLGVEVTVVNLASTGRLKCIGPDRGAGTDYHLEPDVLELVRGPNCLCHETVVGKDSCPEHGSPKDWAYYQEALEVLTGRFGYSREEADQILEATGFLRPR